MITVKALALMKFCLLANNYSSEVMAIAVGANNYCHSGVYGLTVPAEISDIIVPRQKSGSIDIESACEGVAPEQFQNIIGWIHCHPSYSNSESSSDDIETSISLAQVANNCWQIITNNVGDEWESTLFTKINGMICSLKTNIELETGPILNLLSKDALIGIIRHNNYSLSDLILRVSKLDKFFNHKNFLADCKRNVIVQKKIVAKKSSRFPLGDILVDDKVDDIVDDCFYVEPAAHLFKCLICGKFIDFDDNSGLPSNAICSCDPPSEHKREILEEIEEDDL